VQSPANHKIGVRTLISAIFFPDLNKALKSTKPQMGTRAIWEVKTACVRDANSITTDKSRWLRKNMVTNAIFPYVLLGVTVKLIFIFYLPFI
jgi:hypothetical protein